MKNSKKIIAVILAVLCVLSFSGCLKYTGNILEVTTVDSNAGKQESTTVPQPSAEPSSYINEPSNVTEAPTAEQPSTTLPYATEAPTSAAPVTEAPTSAAPATEAPTSAAPATEAPSTEAPSTQAAATDPSQWSTAETLKFLTDAMNKSRAVTTPLTVHHSEAFSLSVSDMNETVASIVNKVIASVAKPSDETLNFNGGKATNSEGETIMLLLPKKGNFYLDEAGCTSVTASKSGNDVVIKVDLIEEKVGMDSAPKYNSTCCGYLDTSSLDLPSIIKISSFDIDYQGTSITFTINPDGYCSKAAYHVPLAIDVVGSGIGIKANIKIGGYEDEVWEVNW